MTAADTRANGPYVGLQPFQAEDRAYFKGRESDQRVLIANLRTAPLTILYGAAGVGKSSLLLAGVVPQLNADLPRTPVIVFRDWVGADFRHRLARACIDATWRLGSDHPRPAEDRPLDEVLRACAEAVRSTVLVLLDQFEEYLLYHPKSDAPDSFEAQVARAVNREDVDVGFLFAVREASVSKLDRFRERIPQLMGNSLRLKHLDEKGAREAIGQPVLDVWNANHPADPPMRIEDELVTQVIRDARADPVRGDHGGQGQTPAEAVIEAPFLQLVMTRIWQEERSQGSQVLRLATLQRLGFAKNIVRSHLDDVMLTLDEQRQAVCASFFDRLVTPSGGKVACNGDDLMKWAGPLAAHVTATLDLLSSRRILRTVAADPEAPEQTRYEIFHEVLAPAILEWHRGYVESQQRQRAVAQARQEARIRARMRWAPWLALSTSVALILLALFVVKYFEADANRKAAESLAVAPYDAARSLELAIDAAKYRWFGSTEATEDALRLAVQATRQEWTQQAFDGVVMGVAFSPDGSKVATRSHVRDGTTSEVIVWEVSSGAPVKVAERSFPDRRLLGGLAFMPSGNTLASVSGDHISLWSFTDPAAAIVELPHGLPIDTAFAVSSDGSLVASAGSGGPPARAREGSIKVWRIEAAGPRLVRTIEVNGAWVMGLSFSPDGCCLAAASVELGKVQPTYAAVWEVSSGRRMLDLPMPVPSDAVAFTPDGRSIVLAGRDSWVRVLRPLVAPGQDDRIVALTDPARVRWNERVLAGHIDRIRDVAVSSDGGRIASASGDRTVRVWDASTGQNLFTLSGHGSFVEAVAFGPKGQQLASVGRDRTLRMWNLAGHASGVYAIAFPPAAAGALMATASSDRTAKLWDVSGDVTRLRRTLGGHSDTIYRMAFDPRGERLATAAYDGTAMLWDVATGELLRRFCKRCDQLRDVAFSADGSFLAIATADGDGWLYSLVDESAEPIHVRHSNVSGIQVSALATDPNRPAWITAGWDGELRRWDHQGKDIGRISKSPDYPREAHITRVAFTRQGTEIAALIGQRVYFWPASRFEGDDGQAPRALDVEAPGRRCRRLGSGRLDRRRDEGH
jgi:WD40 repeat protein